ERGGLRLGDLEHVQVAARNLVDEQIAEMIQQVRQQAAEILAVPGEFAQLLERDLNFAGQDGAAHLENLALGGEAEHGEDIRFLDLVAAKTDELIERGFGIA